METKYGFYISEDDLNQIINRLTNQIWKLIPMKENEENWEQHLRSLIIEISGLDEIFKKKIGLIQILSKMEGILLDQGIPFSLYRKTVFECISLVQELKK